MEPRARHARWMIGIGIAVVGALVTGCSVTVTTGPDGSPIPTGSGTTSAEGDLITYTGNGVTFSYPSGWEEQDVPAGEAEEGTPDWQVAIVKAESDIIFVRQYTLNEAITADSITEAEPELTDVVNSLVGEAGGQIESGPTEATLGGLPALQYEITLVISGVDARSKLTFAFDGTAEYFVNCQSTSDMATEVAAACEQVNSSFALS